MYLPLRGLFFDVDRRCHIIVVILRLMVFLQQRQQVGSGNIDRKLLLDFFAVFFEDVAAQFDDNRQLGSVLHFFQQVAAFIIKGQHRI